MRKFFDYHTTRAMRKCRSRGRNSILPEGTRGTSLIEMLVVTGLVSLILVAVGILISSGMDYYFYSVEQVEVQRRSLIGLNYMSKELALSTNESVLEGVDGLVFASARDASNQVNRDDAGRILWTKLICYYVDTFAGTTSLLRKEENLPGGPNPEVPDPTNLGMDVAYFRGTSNTPRVMSRGIIALGVTKATDSVEIILTAEARNGRNWFEMDVETTIVPRN